RLGVIDVHARREGERRKGRGEDIDQPERRMIGHQMTAALRAILALAHRSLLERRDVLRPRRDPHRFRLPQGERVHRSAGPRTARTALAVTHSLRRARALNPARTANTAYSMHH